MTYVALASTVATLSQYRSIARFGDVTEHEGRPARDEESQAAN